MILILDLTAEMLETLVLVIFNNLATAITEMIKTVLYNVY